MKVGGASWGGELPKLTEEEVSKLKELVPVPLTEEFLSDFNQCLSHLNWDGFDQHAASWSETRPELEKLISSLRTFHNLFHDYSQARIGSPKSAAISVACDPIAEWFKQDTIIDRNDAPFHRELSQSVKAFLDRAEKNLELYIEEASSHGRSKDYNLSQAIYDLKKLQEKYGFKLGISTNQAREELYSPFWEFVIQVVSRIRRTQNAGRNSSQAALTFVKRALRKYRENNPDKL